MMALLGMQDDYSHDGRVLIEALDPSMISQSLTAHHETLLRLAQTYKQINTPFGPLAMNSLTVSTAALASKTPNDAEYAILDGKISSWRRQRNSIASQMTAILEAAAFQEVSIDERQAKQLIAQGEALLSEVTTCAANIPVCAQ